MAAVAPSTGNYYTIQNVAFPNLVWDNSFSYTTNGNSVISWPKNNPATQNQAWLYEQLAAPDQFTLQVESRLKQLNSLAVGYAGATGEQVTQQSSPFGWRLVPYNTTSHQYKFNPVDPTYGKDSQGINLYATAVVENPQVWTNAPTLLLPGVDSSDNPQQIWVFIPAWKPIV